jgi:hypothetical protein
MGNALNFFDGFCYRFVGLVLMRDVLVGEGGIRLEAWVSKEKPTFQWIPIVDISNMLSNNERI